MDTVKRLLGQRQRTLFAIIAVARQNFLELAPQAPISTGQCKDGQAIHSHTMDTNSQFREHRCFTMVSKQNYPLLWKQTLFLSSEAVVRQTSLKRQSRAKTVSASACSEVSSRYHNVEIPASMGTYIRWNQPFYLHLPFNHVQLLPGHQFTFE